MPIILDNTGKEVSEAGVLKTYFGMHPGQTVSEFMKEVKELTTESKTELAVAAAKELGYTIKE